MNSIHTLETAPEAAKKTMTAVQQTFGFVPNLFGVMAEAPPLAEAYFKLFKLFQQTSFSVVERQIVMMAVSYTNGCTYCVAAHTVIAGMEKVPDDIVQAIRDGKPIADSKLQALRAYAQAVTETRGWPGKEVSDGFHAAGYTQTQALEVILGVGFKTLSNYTNHLADTPLDEAFAPAKWEKP